MTKQWRSVAFVLFSVAIASCFQCWRKDRCYDDRQVEGETATDRERSFSLRNDDERSSIAAKPRGELYWNSREWSFQRRRRSYYYSFDKRPERKTKNWEPASHPATTSVLVRSFTRPLGKTSCWQVRSWLRGTLGWTHHLEHLLVQLPKRLQRPRVQLQKKLILKQ